MLKILEVIKVHFTKNTNFWNCSLTVKCTSLLKKKLSYETQILKNWVNVNFQLLEPCTNRLAGENFRGTRPLTHILKKWSVVVVVFFCVHSKQLWSYQNGQLTKPHFSWAGLAYIYLYVVA